MIIRVGHRQLMAIRDAGSDRHQQFVEGAEMVGKNSHDVSMPAVAWRALIDPLTERAFNRFGEWSAKRPGYGSALRRVQASLLALETHPAYLFRAQLGVSSSVFVGFVDQFGRHPDVSPFPPGPLVVLEPDQRPIQVDVGSGPVSMPGTVWTAREPLRRDRKLGLWVDPAYHDGWD